MIILLEILGQHEFPLLRIGKTGISTGSIDIDALTKLVDFFTGKGHPILIIFNYGTTFEGAYDDVKAAGEVLFPIIKEQHILT